MTQKGRNVTLTATNAGDRRIRLAEVKIGSGAKSVSFGPGLAGEYAAIFPDASVLGFGTGLGDPLNGDTTADATACGPICAAALEIHRNSA